MNKVNCGRILDCRNYKRKSKVNCGHSQGCLGDERNCDECRLNPINKKNAQTDKRR